MTYTPVLLNFRFDVAVILYKIGSHLPISMFQYFEVRLLISKFIAVDLSNNSIITFPSNVTSSNGTGSSDTPSCIVSF